MALQLSKHKVGKAHGLTLAKKFLLFSLKSIAVCSSSTDEVKATLSSLPASFSLTVRTVRNDLSLTMYQADGIATVAPSFYGKCEPLEVCFDDVLTLKDVCSFKKPISQVLSENRIKFYGNLNHALIVLEAFRIASAARLTNKKYAEIFGCKRPELSHNGRPANKLLIYNKIIF